MPIAKNTAPKDTKGNALTLQTALAQCDAYRAFPQMGFDALTANIDLCADPRLASVLTECATAIGRYDVAEESVKLVKDRCGMLRAQLHLLQGRAAEAAAVLTQQPKNARLRQRYFGLLMRANLEIGHYDAAVQAAQEWAGTMPNSPTPFKVLAKLLAEQGDGRAVRWYSRAIAVSGGNPELILDLVEFFMAQGHTDKARALLKIITHPSLKTQHRMAELTNQMRAVA